MNTSNTVDGILNWFITIINGTLVPLIFALAFLLFLFGVFKYFFGSGAKAEENRQEGKKFILWGIIAFAVMISIWGLVNVLVNTFGFQNESRPCLPTFSGPCDRSSGSSRSNASSASSGGSPENLIPDSFFNPPPESSLVPCLLPSRQEGNLTRDECRRMGGLIM